jgi:hypothetical protein
MPGHGGAVPHDVVDAAAAIIEYTLDCWRALPEAEGLALSRRDEVLDAAVERLIDWLGMHGGQALRRVLLQNNVAGVKTARDLDQLLERYQERFPGTVVEERQAAGAGRPGVLVHAPARRRPHTSSGEFVRNLTNSEEGVRRSNGSGENEIGVRERSEAISSVPNKSSEPNKVAQQTPDDLDDDELPW